MLDAATGTVLRTVPLPSPYRGVPANPFAAVVDEQAGRVIVAGANTQLYVLDARSGAMLHVLDKVFPATLAVDAASGHVIVSGGRGSGPPAYDGSDIFVIDDRTGRILRDERIFHEGISGLSRMAVLDQRRGRVLLVTREPFRSPGSGSAVYTIDPHDGHIIGAAQIGIFALYAPIALDSQRGIAVVANLHNLYVIDSRSGRLLGTLTFPVSAYFSDVAAVASTGRVFLAGWYTNTITVFDTTRLAATVPTPVPPPGATHGQDHPQSYSASPR